MKKAVYGWTTPVTDMIELCLIRNVLDIVGRRTVLHYRTGGCRAQAGYSHSFCGTRQRGNLAGIVIPLHTEFGGLPTLFRISRTSFGLMSTNIIQGIVLVPLLIRLQWAPPPDHKSNSHSTLPNHFLSKSAILILTLNLDASRREDY
jgi:hypothetical protein